ncbi:MAG TPA: ribonuclease Z [Candidatus Acidoferrales bacterium]|nr:ribonuclease Z [Candidatus Acidoferrales bacterium]
MNISTSVTFLGTGGSVPNKFRNLPSVLVRRGPELFLFDCGEGTQRQFLEARAGINRKMRILISHLHGDHVFGLPGMLHSLSFMGRSRELEIIGPKGVLELVTSVNRVVTLYNRFPIRIREVKPGQSIKDEEYNIRVAAAQHGIPCLAYTIEEKPRTGKFDAAKARRLGVPEGPLWKQLQSGKSVRVGRRRILSKLVLGPPRRGVKITYAVDTRPCASVIRLASGSDLLIHDSCFAESAATKAREYGHSTAGEAAGVAKRSRSRMLALFHISAMYEDASPLLAQAKRVFHRSILPRDMETVPVVA